MSYRLVIAEKPSVAQAYAEVLGATNRNDGYWEGNGYLVSWCVGHLVELAPPNIYDAKYVKWSIADLPILPQQWQYLVDADTRYCHCCGRMGKSAMLHLTYLAS